MRNFIKKNRWNWEYFSADNKCTITDINKSKNSICKKWKLVKNLR